MKTVIRVLLGIVVLSLTILVVSGAVTAAPQRASSDVDVLAGYCHCAEAASMALAPADQGQEVDMAVVNSRRYRAERAMRAADEAVQNIDIAQLRAERDQAMRNVSAAVAAADQGAEVDMAVVASRRFQADRLAHAVQGAELALERAAHHL